jgi:hypothetical protein
MRIVQVGFYLLFLLLSSESGAQDKCVCTDAIAMNIAGQDICIHPVKFGRLQTSLFSYCTHSASKDSTTYIHCGYDSDTTTDEIIRKVDAGQPTWFFKTDTLNNERLYSFIIPQKNCDKITVFVNLPAEKRELVANVDYVFDCENYKLTIINQELQNARAIIRMTWFYRDCN